MKKIIITLNGENKEFDTESGQLSVSKFAEIRNLKGFFAIELNLKIIKKIIIQLLLKKATALKL